MIDRSVHHWIRSGLGASLLAVLGWFLYGTISERRLLDGLEAAARDMEAGNYARSRERLARLAERFRGRGDILFPLGESELACGRAERAELAWSQVPKGSPLAAAAAVRRAQLALEAGQFAEAEKILRDALDESGPESGGVRHLLLSILGLEGRLDEAMALVEDRWRKTAPARRDELTALLHEHLALDLETIPL
jgi:tetratricopeptide (TPR) repeat protein